MRPYIICHMMALVDGRVDCAMTAKLDGVKEYYETLASYEAEATLSGRVTAELELAFSGKFIANDKTTVDQEIVSKKVDSKNYEIVVDTKGTLLWDDDKNYDEDHIIITSERVTKEYLAYLDQKDISYIVCGKDKIDFKKAMTILSETFNVDKLCIVGGPNINGGLLKEGLIDEVSILIGPGIDARRGELGIFDGLDKDAEVTKLKLIDVKAYEDGAVWLRYKV